MECKQVSLIVLFKA